MEPHSFDPPRCEAPPSTDRRLSGKLLIYPYNPTAKYGSVSILTVDVNFESPAVFRYAAKQSAC